MRIEQDKEGGTCTIRIAPSWTMASMYEEYSSQITPSNPEMTIMPLGGGREVGRSCILVKYSGRTVLLDCGIHPGREGMDSCPFFDEVNPAEVDLILITHFHIDHCAALPYFTEHTNFKGRIFMTHATKAVMRLLVSDFIKLLGSSRGGSLYSDQDLLNCIEKIEVVDYHHTVEVKGIKFCGYAAGHVLGAAMFTISIDGVVVLYTGDYSMEEDRHLMPAEIPPEHPDILIVESTYGTMNHSSREERESRFTSTVEGIVNRGGNCLIPVFALGRAQELLLILDEYWQSHPSLHDVPIFYASKLASKALRVYQTFVNMMNMHIQALMDVGNPFHFTHIDNMKSGDAVVNVPSPCVVMASPGMLQNGMSRQLFERWCEDERSGVVIAGYSVEGTLAKKLLSEPEEITCLDGRIKKRKCSIEYISFSAHVDYIQNSKFIRSVVPDSILLVHGEPVEMGRLKVELDKDIARSWPDPTHVPRVEMPENGQTVRLEFAKPIVAEVVGTAADEMLHDMDLVESGAGDDIHFPEDAILVSENFKSKVVTAKDLAAFTPCRLGRIQQRVVIPLPAVVLQLRAHNNMTARLMLQSHLEEVFDDVSLTIHKNPSEKNTTSTTTAAGGTTSPTKESWTTLLVQQILTVEENVENDFITVAWSASPVNDVVADCALGIIYQALSTTHFLRSTWKESSVRSTHAHSHTKAEADNVSSLHSSSPTLSSCKKHDHSSVVNSDHTEEDAIVKRMKLGLVDPSRSFRAPGNRLLDSSVTDGQSVADNTMLDDAYAKRNRPKLEKIKSYLQSDRYRDVFSYVGICTGGLRLIVRTDKRQERTDGNCRDSSTEDPLPAPLEAYVFIHWARSRGHHTHHAVVQSESDWMRREVASAIRSSEAVDGEVAGI